MRPVSPALVVVMAGVVAALHVAKPSPALSMLQTELGLSLVDAGFLLSLVQMAGMLFGLVVGLASDAWGLRRSMVMGLMLLGAASVVGGLARSAEILLLMRAVEGAGFLMVALPAPNLIRRVVGVGRTSAALGLWGAYMPTGTALALLVGPLVLGQWGWSGWWMLLGGASLLMAWGLVHAVPHEPKALAGALQRPWRPRLRETLSASGPWLVAACFAMYSAQWMAVIGFLPSIYAESGVAQGVAGALTALVAWVNIVGNIAAGQCLQRGLVPHRLLLLGFGGMALGAFLAFAPLPGVGATARYAAVVMFSMVGGLIPGTLFSLAVRLAPGDDTVSTTVGWMHQCSAIGQFVGPPLVAWVAVMVGGWHWTWAATAALSLVGGVLALRTAGALAAAR
jgi:CP family cyanate transporter-like MFS transporter